MKKLIVITTLTCLLLTGCGGHNATDPTEKQTDPTVPSTSAPAASEPTVPPTTAPQSITFQVYFPNEDLTAFTNKEVTLQELSADAVMQELIDVGAVNPDVAVNSAAMEGTQLSLDLNGAFLTQLNTLGSTGEHFLIVSVVNTFLSAYGAETVMITADGAVMNSGHAVYDYPLSFIP